MNNSPEIIGDLPLSRDPVTYETILSQDHWFYSKIQPIHKTPDLCAYLRPDYTPEAVKFFVWAIGKIDADLQEQALRGDPLVRQLKTEDQAQELQERVNQEVMRSLRENPKQLTVGSFYGIEDPFRRMQEELQNTQPGAASRLSGAIVSSTNLEKRERPVILTPLDPRWPDPEFSADLIEDMFDSAATAAAIALERIKYIPGIDYPKTYPDLPTQMQRGIDGDFRDYIDLYHTVVGLLEKANIAIAASTSKNQPLMNVLWEHVRARPGSPWAERQRRYLDVGIFVFGQKQWLMGANQYDSGLVGSKILKKIPQDVSEDPKAAAILKFLPQSRIRIGSTTRSIIQLTGDPVDFYAHVGKELGKHLRVYISSNTPLI